MTTAEVEDFGFADSPALYSHIRSPGAITNGTPRPGKDVDEEDGFFTTGLGDAPLNMFNVERAQLNLNITILQLVVSNNILIMASTDSKIYKIDLTLQEQIVEMELHKKQSENKKIKKIFLDIHGDHLLVNTEAGETFYFSARNLRAGGKGRPISRLNNLYIESIAWNPDSTTSATKEILLGTQDGSILETYIELSDYIPNARYLRQLRNFGTPIIGLHVEKSGDSRDVFIASRAAVTVFSGKITRKPGGDISSVYSTFFDEANSGQFQELSGQGAPRISILPGSATDLRGGQNEAYFAWITSPGLFHGNVHSAKSSGDDSIFSDATLLPYANMFDISEGKAILPELSQFHVLVLHENQLVAINRMNNRVVFKETVPTKPREKFIGIAADHVAHTYWIYSDSSVSEIVITDEDRDLWEIYLGKKAFTSALAFAKNDYQRNMITTAEAGALAAQGEYKLAASLYARCNKPFEEVALVFVDNHETDALRLYLTQKLVNLGRNAAIQRTMISTWAIELFLDKLNTLEDSATNSNNPITQQNLKSELETVRLEFQEFISKHKVKDLDRQTTYDLINSHGRETELLFFASNINDHKYVLNYWINRENWAQAVIALKDQTSPEVFYKTASVLLIHVPRETVNVWVQQRDLDLTKLTPALLQYNETISVPLAQNQAVRYLNFAIDHLGSTDQAVHNALISMYASAEGEGEDLLLKYLRAQPSPPFYDVNFALRLCLQFRRVKSGMHIYSSMESYEQAVSLALDNGETDLAMQIADTPEEDPVRRKKLWLSIAEKIISESDGMKKALDLLQRCDLLKIEDLVPLFPDFTAIDDFKEEICAALEDYSSQIDRLKQEMDESARSSQSIQNSISDLKYRYAVIQAGESCGICGYPLLARQFYVFPCRHAFHADCLVTKLKEETSVTLKRRIKEVQGELGRIASEEDRRKVMEEFDSVVAGECILCGDLMVRSIDVGFIGERNEVDGWKI